MAGTKRKFEEDALTKTGYVSSLSPIKISNNNNKYFDGVLQTDSDVYQRMACFDVSLYAEMSRANQQRSPIKVVNCKEVYNRLHAKKTDVLLNYKLDFPLLINKQGRS
ncbi:hypothetical protein FSP39_024678 [Pinctada imbricata]|uniref:Uncharacterized protein n=1 Tax=Pinctada imbricata TaxID=66713 RepID=A0AA89CDL1_PINIB|nr:hypothetical protein FSP39_024678 [Pinctada imbricata]